MQIYYYLKSNNKLIIFIILKVNIFYNYHE
jgi:hypothetical protein